MRLLFLGLLLLATFGCGGGDPRFQNDNTVFTGAAGGALLGVEVRPVPGSYAIPTGTAFSISWRAGALPPPSFTVKLVRYEEGYSFDGYDSDGNSTSTMVKPVHDTQLSLVEQTSELGTPVWVVVPKYTLERGGLYYLVLTSGTDEWRAIFRVSNGRLIRRRSESGVVD